MHNRRLFVKTSVGLGPSRPAECLLRCGARNLPPGFHGMYEHRRRDFEIVEFRLVAYPRSNNRFCRNDPMKSPTQ